MSITVTAATIALLLKLRIKHISSRGSYLSSRKAANSASLLSPYKSWHADIYPSFLSGSVKFFVFTLLFFVRLLLFDVGNGGTFFDSVVVCSHYLQFEHEQTVDFYTADLYLLLLSIHNDNYCKYNNTVVTDYNFKWSEIFALHWKAEGP